MIEQIIVILGAFSLGIIFAHRSAYLKCLEQALYTMADNLQLNLKNKAMNFKLRFDNNYYELLHKIGKKDFSGARSSLELLKYTVEEFLGEK